MFEAEKPEQQQRNKAKSKNSISKAYQANSFHAKGSKLKTTKAVDHARMSHRTNAIDQKKFHNIRSSRWREMNEIIILISINVIEFLKNITAFDCDNGDKFAIYAIRYS